MREIPRLHLSVLLSLLLSATASMAADRHADIREASRKAVDLLSNAAAGSARQRQCFTCHSTAMPVFAMHEARRRGLRIDEENFAQQLVHTKRFLERNRARFEEGRGPGGGVDTAGYALWTLEEGEVAPDRTTGLVAQWLLKKQKDDGRWKTTSDRPPSESSDFTTTYLALRALTAFGTEAQADQIASAFESAGRWLSEARPADTEDRVFGLLALTYVDVQGDAIEAAIEEFRTAQRDDGGWPQIDSMSSDAYATGTVLYALHEVGMPTSDRTWQAGLEYLLSTQQDDGSWLVRSRSRPFQTYYETGFPHGSDQFISTSATAWAVLALLRTLPEATAEPFEVYPGTNTIAWPEADLSQRMMDGAHRFVEEQIRQTNRNRRNANGVASLGDARNALGILLGIVEERHAPRMERFGTHDDPPVVAETETYRISQVRWPVFDRIHGEGLLIEQKGESIADCVLVPDADQTPEQLCGLWSETNDVRPIALAFAENGFNVLVPAIVSRESLPTGDQRLQKADYTDREWIYRQAFHMGRHVIGYDIQRVQAGIDWLHSRGPEPRSPIIGIAGYGEGGLVALHTAAIDPRIDAVLVSGYFTESDFWHEPIYRNVWSRLQRFGNANVASLIHPRTLIIEHSPFPKVTDHKGGLETPGLGALRAEVDRIQGNHALLVAGEDDATVEPWSQEALHEFAASLTDEPWRNAAIELSGIHNPDVGMRRAEQRRARTVQELEDHVQVLVRRSEHVRDDFFLFEAMPELRLDRWTTEKTHATYDASKFTRAADIYRKKFHREAMGSFDTELLAPNPRTRKVAATEAWTAWDVVLDVHDDLFAWGVLVVPNDLREGERRPVVVCQHGRNGLPRDTIDGDKTAYNNFAGQLAERGFITFAPHNLYRGENRYRWLDRKANAIGCSLFSIIIDQHDQMLRWLDSLEIVDGDRIAFYGLSYGGETAVRVPTILQKYCLSICSGDFNQWTRKVAATDQPFSFMNTIEWEMPYWNLGHTFDYAEMAYLMLPRPFMVERGHRDRVGRDSWVAHEFGKVRWLYAQLGMDDRVEIEFFQGGHSIRGEGTFEFLHKHLDWPKR